MPKYATMSNEEILTSLEKDYYKLCSKYEKQIGNADQDIINNDPLLYGRAERLYIKMAVLCEYLIEELTRGYSRSFKGEVEDWQFHLLSCFSEDADGYDDKFTVEIDEESSYVSIVFQSKTKDEANILFDIDDPDDSIIETLKAKLKRLKGELLLPSFGSKKQAKLLRKHGIHFIQFIGNRQDALMSIKNVFSDRHSLPKYVKNHY